MESFEAAAPGSSAQPTRDTRPGASWRDKLFYIGVATVFAAAGVGVAYVAPVLSYGCSKDAGGKVSCTVGRRMYGFLPLSTVRIADLASVEIASERVQPTNAASSEQPTTQDAIVLVARDGTRWQSYPTAWPIGSTNLDLRQGIQGVLDAGGPAQFRGWIAERIALMVGIGFWLPGGIIALSLLVRLAVPRALIEAKTKELEELARRRRSKRSD